MRRSRLPIGILVTASLVAVLAVSPAVAQPAFEPGLARAIEVQERHTGILLGIPDVVGTAVGLGAGRQAVVKVYTKVAGVGVPSTLDGVPVEVQITGEIVALNHQTGVSHLSPAAVTPVDPTASFPRPVPIGVSFGNVELFEIMGQLFCSGGTGGARVTDGIDVWVLSNNHVFAHENEAGIGDAIVQPATIDTDPVCSDTSATDTIGTLDDFEKLEFLSLRCLVRGRCKTNTIDAAIAATTTDLVSNATPADGYGTPKTETISASIDQTVQKYGRTSSLTQGIVTAINATVDVGYNNGTARFVDQIIVESLTAFILSGDSGSLLVTDPGRNPVGLLFAGTSDGTLAVANPIDLVLAAFGVTIDGATGPTASVSISPASQSGQELAGVTGSYTFTVTNTGDMEDTYALSTSSAWASSVSPNSLTLAANTFADVTVSHTVPSGTSPGISDNGTLSVHSAGTGVSASATFTTTARGFAVEITPASQADSGASGDSVSYTYTVANTGTEMDTYTVSTTSGWASSVNATSLILGGGGSAIVTVTHTIPGDADDFASDLGMLTAASLNASAEGTFTTTVTAAVTPTDTVTIKKCRYNTRSSNLHVEATSDVTTATLDVFAIFDDGTQQFVGSIPNGGGKLTAKVTPVVVKVRVDSDLGGSAESNCEIK